MDARIWPKRGPKTLITMGADNDPGVFRRFSDAPAGTNARFTIDLRQSARGRKGPDIKKTLQDGLRGNLKDILYCSVWTLFTLPYRRYLRRGIENTPDVVANGGSRVLRRAADYTRSPAGIRSLS